MRFLLATRVFRGVGLSSEPLCLGSCLHALCVVAASLELTGTFERRLGRCQLLRFGVSGSLGLLDRRRLAARLALHILR